PLHDRSEIHFCPRWHPNTKTSSVPHFGCRASRPDERLRRDAADIETIAAKQVTFNQCDLRAETRGPSGRDQSSGPGSDDHQIVPPRRNRIGPFGGMDMAEQLPVVLIERLQLRPFFGMRPARLERARSLAHRTRLQAE